MYDSKLLLHGLLGLASIYDLRLIQTDSHVSSWTAADDSKACGVAAVPRSSGVALGSGSSQRPLFKYCRAINISRIALYFLPRLVGFMCTCACVCLCADGGQRDAARLGTARRYGVCLERESGLQGRGQAGQCDASLPLLSPSRGSPRAWPAPLTAPTYATVGSSRLTPPRTY